MDTMLASSRLHGCYPRAASNLRPQSPPLPRPLLPRGSPRAILAADCNRSRTGFVARRSDWDWRLKWGIACGDGSRNLRPRPWIETNTQQQSLERRVPLCDLGVSARNSREDGYRTSRRASSQFQLSGTKKNGGMGGDALWGVRLGGLQIGKREGRERRSRGGVIRALTLPSAPLIAAGDTWGTWTVLLAIGAFGIWSEKTTFGSALSGPLVSTLCGLAASNCGLIAASAPAYSVVNSYLLPLAVPLLLYGADLKRVLTSTGRLLVAFTIGSVATTIGTVVALLIVPLRSLGSDGWKIAAALMSRHIGGAVNYVAVSEALGTTPSILAAGLAADNLICAVYFTSLFALAANIPADEPKAGDDENDGGGGFGGAGLKVEEGAISLALSAGICALGVAMAKSLNLKGGGIPCITGIVVLLATVFPSWFGALGPTAEGLAIILLQVFFAVVGASASISAVVTKAPSLFIFSLIQVAVHLAIILGVGKVMGFERKELLLASNANVGGPTTAGGMAAAKGWRSLSVPAILCGIFGIAIATFLSIFFGVAVLQKM